MCSECQQTLDDERDAFNDEMNFLSTQGSIKAVVQDKIYIGSGEDVMMEML
jgi:hypothetical protein